MGVCRDNITDAQFAARLAASEPARKAVVAAYERRGCLIHSEPPVKATTYAEKGHEDIDIRLWRPEWGPGNDRRIEVKGLSQTFTKKSEWPFAKIIVDEAEKFDEKSPKPWCYFLVSRCLNYAFVVDVQETRDKWVHEVLWDSFYKTHIPFYRAWISDLRLVRLSGGDA